MVQTPDERLRAAYVRAQQVGISSNALAALGQGQPSLSWTANLKLLVAFWFNLADLACAIYPPNAEAFTALASQLSDDPAGGAAAWFHHALKTIAVVDPNFAQTLRDQLLAKLS